MKCSTQWLQAHLQSDESIEQIAETLSFAGLEVDSLQAVAAKFDDVVVAEIQEVIQHPNADTLKLCKVFDGIQRYQIVCGATNVRVGLRTALAKIGAVLPGNLIIKKSHIRGEESLGMMCSVRELTLGEDHDGIVEIDANIALGSNIYEYFQLDDQIIEIGVTPNRGDCLSVAGIARDIAAQQQCARITPKITPVVASTSSAIAVNVHATAACPVFCLRVIDGIDHDAQTPLWMRERLRRSGVRLVSPIVDITNYVMLEIGQPMHAFERGAFAETLHVRWAGADEQVQLLNGKTIKLSTDELVIANDTQNDTQAVALAGVMGSLQSEVSSKSTSIVLEAAHFIPNVIRGKSRKFSLNSEASMRFERGVDYTLPQQAIEYATQLLLDIVGGNAGPVVVADTIEECYPAQHVTLYFAHLDKVTGTHIDPARAISILASLGFVAAEQTADSITVIVPTFRFDIEQQADLIEEVLRIYGFDNIPAKLPNFQIQDRGNKQISQQDSITTAMTVLGYQEAITYSFIDLNQHLWFADTSNAVPLRNPISTSMSHMRTSLLPGLIQTLQFNSNRKNVNLRFFEIGAVFQPIVALSASPSLEQIDQFQMVGMAMMCENLHGQDWQSNVAASWYHLKGDLESLMKQHRTFEYQAASLPGFHPTQCAQISVSGRQAGVIGRLDPILQQQLFTQNESPVFLAQLRLDVLQTTAIVAPHVVSKFPAVSRDLALVLQQQTTYAEVANNIRNVSSHDLQSLETFDVFVDEDKIGVGRKSIAIRLTWKKADGTYTVEEIDAKIARICKQLQTQLGIGLRA